MEVSERVLCQARPSYGTEYFHNAKPCAGAIVVRDGRVLLRRRALDPGRGCWDIPGGCIDPLIDD
jgi:ADP-ribose pyrophosphatase YjhB (NUDIX family)